MKIISFFKYENKNYSIILTKENELVCLARENNGWSSKLSVNEKIVFKAIIDSIIVSKDESICLGTKIYNNIPFQLFYDKNKNLYYSNIDLSQINTYVNFKYNHVPYLHCVESNKRKEENERNSKIFKIPVKILRSIVWVSLVASTSLGVLSGCNAVYYQNTTTSEESVLAEKNDDYDYSKIEQAIDNNSNLTDEEKEFLKNMKFFYDDNHEYMDLEKAIKNLETLKIEYCEEECVTTSVNGTYSNKTNTITLYEAKNFDECDITVFIHELLHIFQKTSSDFLSELSNEFFSREVVRKLYDNGIISKEKLMKDSKDSNVYLEIPIYGDGYENYMPVYYCLAEIVDTEFLRQYQFDADINTVQIALTSCKEGEVLDSSEAYKFIEQLNAAREWKGNAKVTREDSKQFVKNAFNSLNYYYRLKNGCDIRENIYACLPYHNKIDYEDTKEDKFLPYNSVDMAKLIQILTKYSENDSFGSSILYFTPKTYLSNDHPNAEISFSCARNIPPVETVEIFPKLKEEAANAYKELQLSEKDER